MNDWSLPGYTEWKVLGEGGFGRVVLARAESTGLPVAIKYLHRRHLEDPVRLAEFRREAAVLHRVVSPYVARLYDFVKTPSGAATVMEAVPGVPLKAVLAADGMLEPVAALAVLKGSLLGLAAAHATGTVHRDYKPDNVLVGPDRQSKLVDFGLAVLAGESGVLAGTPAYMAPEQWAGLPATTATDVYAATCVFFQRVTGRKPFAAQTTDELRAQHQYAPVPPAAAPEPVRGLLARGMAKHPAHRPETASAFVTELEAAARQGYGPEWEQRGRDKLAARAAVLFAASPLAVLAAAGVTAGGVMGATGTTGTAGTAGWTAGTAGPVGKGVLATVGSKVIAGAVGAALVVGRSAPRWCSAAAATSPRAAGHRSTSGPGRADRAVLVDRGPRRGTGHLPAGRRVRTHQRAHRPGSAGPDQRDAHGTRRRMGGVRGPDPGRPRTHG